MLRWGWERRCEERFENEGPLWYDNGEYLLLSAKDTRKEVEGMEPINRKLLKANAKEALKHNFWMIMLVVLVGSLLSADWSGLHTGGSGTRFVSGYNSGSSVDSDDHYAMGRSREAATGRQLIWQLEDLIDEIFDVDVDYTYDDSKSIEDNMDAFGEEVKRSLSAAGSEVMNQILIIVGVLLLVIVIIWILAIVISFAMGTFAYAPIGVGYRRYFMRNRHRDSEFMDIFSSFKKGKYMNIVKSMFSTNIRIWGWSLLFYFPGLVKYYQYYFVSWIMAENPDISPERARELSRNMTQGHKWQIFVLELSFFGWYLVFVLEEILLAVFSCGLLAIPGMLLVLPVNGYIETTKAELYAERREWMLANGNASPRELKGFIPQQPEMEI